MSSEKENTKINDLIWKTTVVRQSEKFQRLLSKEGSNASEHFGIEYITKLSEKVKSLSTLNTKLYLIYLLLIVCLFLSQYSGSGDFNFLGYEIKNLDRHKEFILFSAALILPFISLNQAYKAYLDELMKQSLKVYCKDESTYHFYKQAWLYEPGDALFKPKQISDYVYSHTLVTAIEGIFIALLVMLFLSAVTISFMLQIVVIYDVAMEPSHSGLVNTFVLIFTIASLTFTWILAALRAPLPEKDYSIYTTLEELKNKDKNAYRNVSKSLSKKRERRQFISQLLYFLFCYTIVYSIVLFHITETPELDAFSWTSFLSGAWLTTFASLVLVDSLSRFTKWLFFKRKFSTTDKEVNAFMRLNKSLTLFTVVVPFLLSTLFALTKI